jgi:hypothetical protein
MSAQGNEAGQEVLSNDSEERDGTADPDADFFPGKSSSGLEVNAAARQG